jgi:hypothetical protein
METEKKREEETKGMIGGRPRWEKKEERAKEDNMVFLPLN